MIGLDFEMTYTVRTTEPSAPSEGSPLGVRQYWQVNEATLKGARIDARLASTGSDWMAMSPDGFWRPDVRAQFETADGAFVFLHYTGLVEQTARFKAAAEASEETAFDDHYMRLAMRFDTGDARYAWLGRHLFIAQGRLLGTGHIEYAVYRVT